MKLEYYNIKGIRNVYSFFNCSLNTCNKTKEDLNRAENPSMHSKTNINLANFNK
jgi:hypothetical protein